MTGKKNPKNIIYVFLSGVLSILAFPPFNMSLAGWIALVPLLLIFSDPRAKNVFFSGFLYGIIFFGGTLYWLNNVTVPGTIALIAALSLFCGIFATLCRYVFKRPLDLLAIPLVWVVLEYAKSHVFTGFPWAFLGYSQYENLNIIQIADITGVYGVSFIMAVFNVAVFSFIKRLPNRTRYLITALLVLIMTTAYGTYCLEKLKPEGSLDVSVIQANIPQDEKWNPAFSEKALKEHVKLTETASKERTDLVIWPETSYPYLIKENDKDAFSELKTLSEKSGVPLLIGAVYNEKESYFNSAFLVSGKKENMPVYRKMHLVPFGEYVPFEKNLFFLRDVIDKPIGDFSSGEEYTLFPVRSVTQSAPKTAVRLRNTRFYKFGVLICFEDIFPYIARNFVKEGADFLVNITNDAWFGNTAAARQHVQASVFRAVENRAPVIRAANTGISCFISAKGKIHSIIREQNKEIFVSGARTEKVEVYPVKSYYTMYGDIFIFFCIFMLVFIFAQDIFKKKQIT